jgi:hypothetical protein
MRAVATGDSGKFWASVRKRFTLRSKDAETQKNARKPVHVSPGWWPRLRAFCKKKWEHDRKPGDAAFDIYQFTGISRRTFSTARHTNEFTESTFCNLVEQIGCDTPEELLGVLSPPSDKPRSLSGTSSARLPPAENPKTIVLNTNKEMLDLPAATGHQPPQAGQAASSILDEQLLLDHLAGVGYAEFLGNRGELESALRNARASLKGNPEDVYVRGMLLWSVLNTGHFTEMVEVLRETGQWLTSPRPRCANADSESKAWRKAIEERIEQINKKAVPHPGFVRWHLEDTLARAALLRWLKFQGKSSPLQKEFLSLGQDLKNPLLDRLSTTMPSQQGSSWLTAATELAKRWTEYERSSPLPRLCWLWFTGQEGRLDSKKHCDRMLSAIGASRCWLEQNPDQTLVRWATLWLTRLRLRPTRCNGSEGIG